MVKRSESKYASDQKFHQFLAQLPNIAIQAYDADGTVHWWNKASEKLYGYTEKEAIGSSLLDLIIPEEAKDYVRGTITDAVNHAIDIPSGEIMLRHKNGHNIPVYSSHVVLKVSGEPARLFCIDIDLQEQKATEAVMQRNTDVQSVLRQIAEAALLSSSLNELYATVHQLVEMVLPAQHFYINLMDSAAGEIVVPFRSKTVEFVPERRKLGKGMTEYVMRQGRAIHLKPAELIRLRESGEYTLIHSQEVLTRHYIGAPLIDSQRTPFGVMTLILKDESQAFQPEDVEIFSTIAAQVSMAIERRRLETELQIQASTDELTGLSNRRYFMTRAEDELNRINRFGKTCSLLLFDIDHFKRINDNYGHATGDDALKKISAICKQILRSTDLVGRIGGEEFSVLLIETGLSDAIVLAELLRQHFQNNPLVNAQGISIPMQVSIGAAERTSKDETLSDLMNRCDKALYRAKNEGRNRVVAAD